MGSCVMTPSIQQGMVDVIGGKVWFKLVGSGNETPLVTLHGGPGFPHNSLAPLAELSDERPVLFYDQLGCGKSDRPTDQALWAIPRFIDELVRLCKTLELERISIFGHSWGTMLAVDYYLAHPEGIEKLILASPMLSATRWKQDGQVYIQQLPQAYQDVIAKHDAGEKHNEDLFKQAEQAYSRRHFCRLDPWPEEMKQAGGGFGGDVYHAMWGQCEWNPSGSLATYERVDRLHEIQTPVLLTSGRFDEATPEATDYYMSHIPNAQMQGFENSSHVAHFEERENYLGTIREFLATEYKVT